VREIQSMQLPTAPVLALVSQVVAPELLVQLALLHV
jgi:hypothetical protein